MVREKAIKLSEAINLALRSGARYQYGFCGEDNNSNNICITIIFYKIYLFVVYT